MISHDCTAVAYAKLPEFLRNTKFQNPEDPKHSPWSTAEGVDHAFTEQNPKEKPIQFQAFHAYIHGMRKHRPHWTSFYPVRDRLIEGAQTEGDASAFVDVGGSLGHILQGKSGVFFFRQGRRGSSSTISAMPATDQATSCPYFQK